MPVQNMGETDSVPRGKWATANQEVPEGIYLQSHVPRMMVLAKVATGQSGYSNKIYYGF